MLDFFFLNSRDDLEVDVADLLSKYVDSNLRTYIALLKYFSILHIRRNLHSNNYYTGRIEILLKYKYKRLIKKCSEIIVALSCYSRFYLFIFFPSLIWRAKKKFDKWYCLQSHRREILRNGFRSFFKSSQHAKALGLIQNRYVK